jgi:hypothetical protein
MGVIKAASFLVGTWIISYTITTTILRMNKKQSNIRNYYPQNAINI